ncbi:MAG TPA: pectin acetylesterase-family hydrolase [Nannocystis sp.]|jgi:hypothetical protein
MPAASPRVLIWLLPCPLVLATACGDGGEASTNSTSTTDDDGGDPPTTGSACGGDVIDAPPGQWTWVPVEGARCGRGSPTGMAINPGGDRLLIYMLFGGACSTAEECAPDCDPQAQRCALHLDGFDETTFKDTLGLFGAGSIFDREDPGNPYRDHSFAFIPYCTGDFHSGDREAEYGISHVGYRNMGLYLERLVPSFCGATDVVLVGSSAGGFGAVFNYDRVREAFAPRRVDLVDDAGPPLGPEWMPIQTQMRAAWGSDLTAPAGCPACASRWDAFLPYLGATAPEARLALISSLADTSIGPFFGGPIALPADYTAAMNEYADLTLGPVDRVEVFYLDEPHHVYLVDDLAQTGPPAVSLQTWLTQMHSDDPAWASVRP